MVANIIKIFETCKLFWPKSEDFVNFATFFVNSATPRGRAPAAPFIHFLSVPPERCSFVKRAKISVLFSGAEKRTKRDIPPTKAFLRPVGSKRPKVERPRGKDATAPPRRSFSLWHIR